MSPSSRPWDCEACFSIHYMYQTYGYRPSSRGDNTVGALPLEPFDLDFWHEG